MGIASNAALDFEVAELLVELEVELSMQRPSFSSSFVLPDGKDAAFDFGGIELMLGVVDRHTEVLMSSWHYRTPVPVLPWRGEIYRI